MSEFDLVVSGNIVEADKVVENGWLAARDGKIVARGTGRAPQARDRVEAAGRWIMPGAVDGQVHAGSQAGQEGLGHASRAWMSPAMRRVSTLVLPDPAPATISSAGPR